MLNIIIVDDNKSFDINFFNYIKQNKSSKINVQGIATNGLEALDLIKTCRPDVILLDLKMPKLDGVEFLNCLQNENIKLPYIILITGYPKLSRQIKNYNNIINDILIKPINLDELAHKLSLLDNKMEENVMYDKFTKILAPFTFNTLSIGYRYILDGLILYTNINTSLPPNFNLQKHFYYNLANKYSFKNISKIKWNVDKTIKSMIRYTDKYIFKKYFPNNAKLTSKTLIHRFLEIYYYDKITI